MLLRVSLMAACLAATACAPAPVRMTASEASERLERFASGSLAADVCTPGGRAVLRGAVRAYSAAMAQAGVAWPALPESAEEGQLRNLDVAVVVAFAAGLVERSDIDMAARARLAPIGGVDLLNLRAAGRVACAEVLQLQQAASRVVAELDRYQRLAARDAAGRRDRERLVRQRQRLEQAQADMQRLAAFVQEEVEMARRARDS